MENDGFSGINIVPLVDIMLVLLTIVLITSNFMVRGILPVNLPKSESATADTVKEVILFEVTKEGDVFFKEQQIAIADIPMKLSGYDTELQVIVSADKDLTIQPFISVMDALKTSGFSKISIQTER